MARFLGNALIFASAAGSVLFVVLYHLRAPWWRSATGVHLMAFTASEAAVLSLSCVRIVVGDAPWFQAVRLVVFVSIPFVIWWRVVLLVQAQRGVADEPSLPAE